MGIFCLSRGGCHEAELLIDGNCDYEPRQKWLLYLSSGRRNGSNEPRKSPWAARVTERPRTRAGKGDGSLAQNYQKKHT
jgi:hypothetical protein